MTITSDILHKLRRAYRNTQGTHFSAEELRHLARLGTLHILAKAEADELVASLEERLESDRSLRPAGAPTELPRAFSVKSLAARWSCSETLVRKLVANGELNSFRHGSMIRIPVDAVLERERVS